MKKIYKIKVKLLSPLHINAGNLPDGKRATVKQKNKPYIPATLFKGIVRDKFEQLLNTFVDDYICEGKENADKVCNCLSCSTFGKAGFSKSRIIFDNLETEQELICETRTNIAINRYLKKNMENALVFSEVVSPYDKNNDPVEFKADITVYYNNDETYRETEKYVCTAIENIKTIGLGKSRGIGFVEVNVDYEEKN